MNQCMAGRGLNENGQEQMLQTLATFVALVNYQILPKIYISITLPQY